MSVTTKEIVKQSDLIIKRLSEGIVGMDNEGDIVKFVYNHAVDDCANFLRVLVKHNPLDGGTLGLASIEVRRLMTLREESDGESEETRREVSDLSA